MSRSCSQVLIHMLTVRDLVIVSESRVLSTWLNTYRQLSLVDESLPSAKGSSWYMLPVVCLSLTDQKLQSTPQPYLCQLVHVRFTVTWLYTSAQHGTA